MEKPESYRYIHLVPMFLCLRVRQSSSSTTSHPRANGLHGNNRTSQQEYTGLAWVRYDAAFRRRATLTNNIRWSVIDRVYFRGVPGGAFAPSWD